MYANIPFAMCKGCGVQRELLPNPGIIDNMVDESGSMKASKIVWHEDAWNQLLYGSSFEDDNITTIDNEYARANFPGRPERNVKTLNKNDLQDIEDRLLYSRVTLTFGWAGDLERLCIMWAEW